MFLRPFQLLKANRPHPWTGRSAVHFGPPTEPKTVLFEHIRYNGGPFTPQERTVHPPGADRPQVYFQQKCISVKRP